MKFILKFIREIVLFLVIIFSFIFFFLQDPIHQNSLSHQFADDRTLLGIPNFFNLITNILFFVVGWLGLSFCLKNKQREAPWSWALMFLGVVMVCFGSSYYHWSPNNQSLVWDRLPMTVGFMGLTVAFVTEYVNEKLEKYLLLPAILLGITSVLIWVFTDDLRIYFWVQAFPFLCILLMVLVFRGRYSHQSYLLYGVLLYILAKVTEAKDGEIYTFTEGNISGHSLKHLLAGLGVYFIYLMLKFRKNSNN